MSKVEFEIDFYSPALRSDADRMSDGVGGFAVALRDGILSLTCLGMECLRIRYIYFCVHLSFHGLHLQRSPSTSLSSKEPEHRDSVSSLAFCRLLPCFAPSPVC